MGFIILLVVLIVVCFAGGMVLMDKVDDDLGCCTISGGIICFFVLFFAIITAIVNNVGYDAFVAEKQALHDGLVYQFENNLYDNNNDLGKKELYDQIVDYNKTVARGKEWTHDPWFGIFWSDGYDVIDYIDFN